MTSFYTRQPGAIKQALIFKQKHNVDPHQLQQCTKNISSICINLSSMNIKHFYQQLQNIQTQSVNKIILDDNKLTQCVLDLSIFTCLETMSIQKNQLIKFSLKRSFSQHSFSNLTTLNLSQNRLQFLDLNSICNLKHLTLSHNNLSTIILPQKYLQSIDISYNVFSNIQYSVLSGKVFQKLSYLDISHNNRSLYDLILAIGEYCLVPSLKHLNCGYNVLSYIQSFPCSLQYLNLQENQFIFDRRSINQVIRLKNLKQLNIKGNSITEDFIQILEIKLQNTNLKIKFQYEEPIKQSPYRIYQYSEEKQPKPKEKIKSLTYCNFTLADDVANNDIIDPQYNLLEQPSSHKQIVACLNIEQSQINSISQDSKFVLKTVENKLKTQKFKLKIEGTRFHNHYKLYFQKLQQFMKIPPYPILHKNRSANISVRVDPSQNKQFINEFDLLNQMFKVRGGIHYLRKVYNWIKTQNINNSNSAVMFINFQLNRHNFEQVCNGNYQILDSILSQRHALNQQPCSFTCYHILARVNMGTNFTTWSCLYLIQAAHL